MSSPYISSIAKLIEQFEMLPGIGYKTAQRLAFYVLGLPKEKANGLGDAIREAKEKVKCCKVCCNLTDSEPCSICASSSRDRAIICIVENPTDAAAMERSKEYKGLYHVLHGAISPMRNIGPDDICIKELLKRLESEEVKEIILATNPTLEGEATAMYIAKLIKPFGIHTTRIARGIPIGADLEYADEITLTKALEGRRPM